MTDSRGSCQFSWCALVSPCVFCLLFCFTWNEHCLRHLFIIFPTVACFVDITVGFDISSQREGHHLFYGQTKLEKHFPDILQALLSLRDVSCNVGFKAQSSVAVHVKNTVTPISAKFYIDKESVLRNLSDAVIKRPSRLNVDFLQSLWETFQNEDKTRQKVMWWLKQNHLIKLYKKDWNTIVICFCVIWILLYVFAGITCVLRWRGRWLRSTRTKIWRT